MKHLTSLIITALVLASCSSAQETTINTEAPKDSQVANTKEDVVEANAPVTLPIEDFFDRITLKPYGIYITPENSPVSPERFSGYHNASDAEALNEKDVPVFAIADGTTQVIQWINGYGGVIVIEHIIDEKTYTALYGHIDIDSTPLLVGGSVKKGDQIAVLGEGGTAETDYERAHLHFALREGSSIDYRGYVQSEPELDGWIDPAVFLQEKLND